MKLLTFYLIFFIIFAVVALWQQNIYFAWLSGVLMMLTARKVSELIVKISFEMDWL